MLSQINWPSMIEEEIKTILLRVFHRNVKYLVLKYLPFSQFVYKEITNIWFLEYLPFSLPDPNVFRTTTRERTFEKKKFNEFKRRSFYDMQVECRLEKKREKIGFKCNFLSWKREKKGFQMRFSQLKKERKNGFQMQFSQLKKRKKRFSNAIFSAEKKTKRFSNEIVSTKKKNGFQMQFSQLKKRKNGFQMQFSQLNTEAGQIKYLGEATLGGQCHVPYMQVRRILN